MPAALKLYAYLPYMSRYWNSFASTSLPSLCLDNPHASGVADVAQFLGTGMDPPEPSAIVNALSTLRALDAIDEHERLLPLGHHLVSLPVEPAIGRMLIMGAVFDCLDPVLTIAASLTYRSPFVLPVDSDARRRADDAKKELAYPHSSDHFALLNAYNKFRRLASSQQPGAVYRWCRDKFVAKDTMDLITVQRKELVYVRGIPSSSVRVVQFQEQYLVTA